MSARDVLDILESPTVVTVAVGVLTIVGGLVGAWIQRGIGRQVERDRFRHDIAAKTAETRLTAHTQLAALLAAAYRDKLNAPQQAQASLDKVKNHYYENRYFFSPELGKAFGAVTHSLSLQACSADILESNLNAFFGVIRDDLLLRELSESVHRAVHERHGECH